MSYLLMGLTGLLIVLPLTYSGLYFLAWIAFIPTIYAIKRVNKREAFIGGWILGTVLMLGTGYGLSLPVLQYSNLPLPLAGIILACLYLVPGLYYGVWALLYQQLRDRRVCHPTLIAVSWVAMEYLRYRFLRFYPLGFVGYTQSGFKFLLQMADIGGVLLISFIVILINGYLYKVFIDRKRKAVAFLLIIFLVIMGYGGLKWNQYANREYNLLKVGVIYTAIPQNEKWKPANIENNSELLINNLKQLSDVSLAITPETALTFDLKRNQYYREKFLNRVKELDFYLQTGSQAIGDNGSGRHNTSFLISSGGQIVDRYNKLNLVIGEYIPLEITIKQFNPDLKMASLIPGTENRYFETNFARWKTVICSEIFYPFTGDDRIEKAQFIVNQANEAWFDRSNMHQQMWSAAVIRAVESRKTVVKSGNMAINGVISPAGSGDRQKHLNRHGVFRARVYLNQQSTRYLEWKDFIGVFSLLIFGISLGLKLIFHYRQSSEQPETAEEEEE